MGNLKGKTFFILAILVIFIYGIFYGWQLPTTSPVKSLKNGNIHLGLDLKGGSHLVLQVAVQEAINSTTDRDVQRLNEVLGATGGTAAKLDLAHPEKNTVTGTQPTQDSAIHDIITGQDYAAYDVSSNPGGGYVLTMKEQAIR